MRRAKSLLLLFGLAACIVGCSDQSRINETIQRGNVVIQALEQYKADHDEYPAALADLSPNYLKEIPQPTWGLRVWDYSPKSAYWPFQLGVNENERSGHDGYSLWLRWLGPKNGWQTGD